MPTGRPTTSLAIACLVALAPLTTARANGYADPFLFRSGMPATAVDARVGGEADIEVGVEGWGGGAGLRFTTAENARRDPSGRRLVSSLRFGDSSGDSVISITVPLLFYLDSDGWPYYEDHWGEEATVAGGGLEVSTSFQMSPSAAMEIGAAARGILVSTDGGSLPERDRMEGREEAPDRIVFDATAAAKLSWALPMPGALAEVFLRHYAVVEANAHTGVAAVDAPIAEENFDPSFVLALGYRFYVPPLWGGLAVHKAPLDDDRWGDEAAFMFHAGWELIDGY